MCIACPLLCLTTKHHGVIEFWVTVHQLQALAIKEFSYLAQQVGMSNLRRRLIYPRPAHTACALCSPQGAVLVLSATPSDTLRHYRSRTEWAPD